MFMILNGKKITKKEYAKKFNVTMRRFIQNAIEDAKDEGQTSVMFNTDLGPLLVVF